MEKINVTDRSNVAAVLLMNALGTNTDLVRKLAAMPGSPFLEVELRVNGLEVPFTAAVVHMVGQVDDQIEERAAEKALDMVRGTKMKKLAEQVHDLTWKFEQAFSEAGFEVRADDY